MIAFLNKTLRDSSAHFQKIKISNPFFIFIFFLVQTLAILLPILSLIQPQSSTFFSIYSQLIDFHLALFDQHPSASLSFNLLIFSFSIFSLCSFVFPSSIGKYGLYVTAFYLLFSIQFIEILAQQLFIKDFTFYRGINIINIFLILALSFFYSLARWSYSSRRINHLLMIPSNLKLYLDFGERIMMIWAPYIISQDSRNIQVLWVLMYLLLTIANIYISLRNEIFFKKYVSDLYKKTISLKFSIITSCLIYILTEDELLLNNLLIVSFSIFMFSSVTLSRYVEHYQQKIQLQEISNLLHQKVVILHLILIARTFLKEQDQKSQKMATMSTHFYLSEHQKNCRMDDCFCVRQKSLSLEKDIFSSKASYFAKKFPKNAKILSASCILKIQIAQNFSKIFIFLQDLKLSQSVTHFNHFLIDKSELSLAYFLKMKNSEIGICPIQEIMQLDTQSHKFCMINENLLAKKIDFWEKMYRSHGNLHEMDSNIQCQLLLRKEAEKIEQIIIDKNIQSCEHLKALLIFHCYIELSMQIPPKLQKLIKKTFLSKTKLHSSQPFPDNARQISLKSLDYQASCLLETKIDEMFGTIRSASKSIERVLGFPKKMLINEHINRLLPKSMWESHDKLMKKWLSKSEWENIGKLRPIFGLKNQNRCFQGTIYLKIIKKIEGLSLIGLITVRNDQNYMLITEAGIIQGAGIYCSQKLGNNIYGKNVSQVFVNFQSKQSIENESIRNKSKIEIKTERYCSKFRRNQPQTQYEKTFFYINNCKYNILYLKEEQTQDKFEKEQSCSLNVVSSCALPIYQDENVGEEIGIKKFYKKADGIQHNQKGSGDSKMKKHMIGAFVCSLLGLILISGVKIFEKKLSLMQRASLQKSIRQKTIIEKAEVLYFESLMMLQNEQKEERRQNNLIYLKNEMQLLTKAQIQLQNQQYQAFQNSLKQFHQNFYWVEPDQTKFQLKPPSFLNRFLFSIRCLNEQQNLTAIITLHQNYQVIEKSLRNFLLIYKKQTANFFQESINIIIVTSILFMVAFIFRAKILINLQIQRKQQGNKLITLFNLITKQNSLKMRNYLHFVYRMLTQVEFKERNLLEHKPCFVESKQIQNKHNFQMNNVGQSSFKAWSIRLLIVLINAVFLYSDYQYKQQIHSLRSIFIDLMIEENQIISSVAKSEGLKYFNLDQDTQILNKFEEGQSNIRSVQILFEIHQILQERLPNYKNFINYLSDDLCEVLLNFSQPELVSHCSQNFQYSLYKQGFLTTINMLQRHFISHEKSPYKKSLSEKFQIESSQYSFSTAKHSLQYLQLFFGGIKKHILQNIFEYVESIKKNSFCEYVSVLNMIIGIVMVINLFHQYREDKQKRADNIGKILVVPYSLIESTTTLSRQIQKTLQI